MTLKYPKELAPLIAHLRKLPGVGTRTAERFAFELIGWEQAHLVSFADVLSSIREKIPPCSTCGCLTEEGSCQFCNRDESSQMCIIASARDVFSIEATGTYRGLYHVVEHLISPLDGRHANALNVGHILTRLKKNNTEEVILGFDSTLEGDTTALYLKAELQKDFSGEKELHFSRLAFGLPLGSSLEYVDGGTLTRSLKGRQTF